MGIGGEEFAGVEDLETDAAGGAGLSRAMYFQISRAAFIEKCGLPLGRA